MGFIYNALAVLVSQYGPIEINFKTLGLQQDILFKSSSYALIDGKQQQFLKTFSNKGSVAILQVYFSSIVL